jgi:peroxiredoxin
MELEALQAAAGEFASLGATLVGITPQTKKFNRHIIDKHQITFDLLSDPGNDLAQQFGLLYELPDDMRQVYQGLGIDLERFNADSTWRLPMPARYVIDRDSVIRWSNVSPNHTVRPEPEETLAFIREMLG